MPELREALHHASPPPRGEEAAFAVSKIVVAAAHRRRRRLTAIVGGAAAAAIVLIFVTPLRLPSNPGITLAPSVAGSVPDPAPAAAAPVVLSDGTPVFAVRRHNGTAGVVSAISTHLGRFVAWCPESRTFVDRPHDSFFDERGRWLTGPAPRDLPSADAIQVDSPGEGARLLPEPLQEHPARSLRIRPDRVHHVPPPTCDGKPVTHGDPDMWEVRTVEEALARPGEFSLVTGRVTFDGTGASFCRADPMASSSCETVPVLSLFHKYDLQFLEGGHEGHFLVKPQQDAFIDLIALPTTVRVED